MPWASLGLLNSQPPSWTSRSGTVRVAKLCHAIPRSQTARRVSSSADVASRGEQLCDPTVDVDDAIVVTFVLCWLLSEGEPSV
jgi:hypothetical protein